MLNRRRESSQLLAMGGTGCVGFGVAAGPALILSSRRGCQIIFVATTAPAIMATGMQKQSRKTNMPPLMFILKIPNVNMQATESQIVHVEMVFDNSLFMVFLGFVLSPDLLGVSRPSQ